MPPPASNHLFPKFERVAPRNSEQFCTPKPTLQPPRTSNKPTKATTTNHQPTLRSMSHTLTTNAYRAFIGVCPDLEIVHRGDFQTDLASCQQVNTKGVAALNRQSTKTVCCLPFLIFCIVLGNGQKPFRCSAHPAEPTDRRFLDLGFGDPWYRLLVNWLVG